MQEPRDGDFVAYIDALQRESAARLAQQHVSVANPAFPHGVAQPRHDDATTPNAPATRVNGGLAPRARAPDAKLLRALVAAVVGAAFLVSWLGGSGAFSLILAVVLLAYAAPRLAAAYRERDRPPARNTAAAIDHVFGRSGTPTTGTKR